MSHTKANKHKGIANEASITCGFAACPCIQPAHCEVHGTATAARMEYKAAISPDRMRGRDHAVLTILESMQWPTCDWQAEGRQRRQWAAAAAGAEHAGTFCARRIRVVRAFSHPVQPAAAWNAALAAWFAEPRAHPRPEGSRLSHVSRTESYTMIAALSVALLATALLGSGGAAAGDPAAAANSHARKLAQAPTRYADFIVIGAGMAGMTAARDVAAKLGAGRVIVLEARRRVGGR